MRRIVVLIVLSCSVAAFARQPVRARKAMVVAQEPIAAEVGLEILKKGGNAVDAAVAVGFALAVTHPYAGNIGGGGFMLVRLADGRVTFFDFRERAPGKASRDMYIGPDGKVTRDSLEGWRAAGVPGTVRGLETAHHKLGKKKWQDLLDPALRLATDGFPVSYSLSESLRTNRVLPKFEESKRIFQNDGKFYEMGDTFRQSELARTLQRIARHGSKDFYEGETAKRLAQEMEKNGGLISLEDLRGYAVVERKPLEGDYRGYHLITAPPPSAGGFGILQMLGMLEGSGYEKSGAGSAAALHYMAEAMRRAYADRMKFAADPDFVKVPWAGLLNREYLKKRSSSIDPNRATSSASVEPGEPAFSESSETTHYSVVDADGNAVAVTYTLNGGYGCGVTVPGLGFLLNNEMDDFAAQPGTPNMFKIIQGEANAIQPGKRPVSSMVPTVVLREGKLYAVLGAPGGTRIPTAVLQVFLNIVDFGMNPQDAVDAPRIHHQWNPDRLSVDRAISPDTVALLKQRGHEVDTAAGAVGARVEAIVIDRGWLMGGTDGRGSGKVVGY
jgi:gamma-glutamyltranspeptidase/glutathione hydrolase